MKASWKIVKVGEACELLTGGTPSRQNLEYFGGDIRWLVSGDINQKEILDCEGRITALGFQNSNARLLPKNSVMIALAGQGKTRGTVAMLRIEATCNQSMVCMAPKEPDKLMPEFLYYNLHGRYQEIRRLTGDDGNDRRGLSMGIIYNIEIPLPPLAEQKRIVALLDEALAGIDAAKAKTECNVQAATDLLESRLSELFLRPKETPSMISDHCTEVTVGYVGPMADKYVPNGIPFLRSQNVRPFEINFDNLMQITPAFEKSLAKSRLAPGDVVVVRTGYPGTAAVIPTELPMANCADLVILRPMKSLDPNYLVAFFNSKVGKDMVLGRLVGAAQKHFNVGAAKSVLLPIPTIQRQREVVSHISEIRTHIGKLMDNSESKLSELSELKASTLAQAFAGELTA